VNDSPAGTKAKRNLANEETSRGQVPIRLLASDCRSLLARLSVLIRRTEGRTDNFRVAHPRKIRLLIQYLSELIAISEQLGEVLTQ
jgi:hypothetical protein